MKYFKQLDGLRFLSIAAVMLGHFGNFDFLGRLPLGYGVMLFFVLSSFLITRILLITKGCNETNGESNAFSIRQFYIRRFLRIFPIYYLVVIATYAINWVPCREIIAYLLTYTVNFRIATGGSVGDFTHLWSLAVEEQFYIFFPFLVFFLDTKNVIRIAIAFILIGVIGRAGLYMYNSDFPPFSVFNTISCLDSLGVGSVLAYMSLYKPESLKKVLSNKTYFWGSIALFLILMLCSHSFLSTKERDNFVAIVFMRFSFNVMAFWILGRAAMFGYKGAVKSFLENSVVIYLGRISYGMYLYHLFVPRAIQIVCSHFKINIDFLPKENAYSSSWLALCIYIAVTIIVSSISWFVIEKPINNLKRLFEYNKKVNRISAEKTAANIS